MCVHIRLGEYSAVYTPAQDYQKDVTAAEGALQAHERRVLDVWRAWESVAG